MIQRPSSTHLPDPSTSKSMDTTVTIVHHFEYQFKASVLFQICWRLITSVKPASKLYVVLNPCILVSRAGATSHKDFSILHHLICHHGSLMTRIVLNGDLRLLSDKSAKKSIIHPSIFSALLLITTKI